MDGLIEKLFGKNPGENKATSCKKTIAGLLVFVLLFALCGCAEPIGSEADSEQSAAPSFAPEQVSAAAETANNTNETTPREQTDPDGKRLFQPGDESFFPLYAMIPEERIYLYGVHPYGMVLYHNGTGTYFDWPGLTPRLVLPQMQYRDFDGDGKEELAVTLYWGSGTGFAMMDLHMLKIKDAPDGWRSPTYVDYSLSAADVYDWMSEPITVTVAEDNNSFSVDVCGDSYTLTTLKTSESTLQCTFSSIAYGDIVYFSFENNQIRTKIAIGATYEEIAPPLFFGTITATVTFDGEALTLEDYSFALDY